MTKTGATVVQPLPLHKRKYLANYLGRAQGKAGRLKLIELAKQFPEKVCHLCLVGSLGEILRSLFVRLSLGISCFHF